MKESPTSHNEIILRENDEDISNPKLVGLTEIMNKYFIIFGHFNLPSQLQRPPDYMLLIVKQETPT